MLMHTLKVPITSISKVKQSPMDVFQMANEENTGVYVFNREKVAGVMLTLDQYESLNNEIEELYDQLAELIAERRVMYGDVATFSDEEVRGITANESIDIDENDGWK